MDKNRIEAFIKLILQIDVALLEYEFTTGEEFDLFSLSKEDFEKAREIGLESIGSIEE
jgi:hypothetical protein